MIIHWNRGYFSHFPQSFSILQHSQGTMVAMVTSLSLVHQTRQEFWRLLDLLKPQDPQVCVTTDSTWSHHFAQEGTKVNGKLTPGSAWGGTNLGEGEQVPRSSHIIVFFIYAVLMWLAVSTLPVRSWFQLDTQLLWISMESNSAIF